MKNYIAKKFGKNGLHILLSKKEFKDGDEVLVYTKSENISNKTVNISRDITQSNNALNENKPYIKRVKCEHYDNNCNCRLINVGNNNRGCFGEKGDKCPNELLIE